jgi:hypothetical protein
MILGELVNKAALLFGDPGWIIGPSEPSYLKELGRQHTRC